jgi:peptidyl-prolyl cis-trans isomerase B (cyclophilin B)
VSQTPRRPGRRSRRRIIRAGGTVPAPVPNVLGGPPNQGVASRAPRRTAPPARPSRFNSPWVPAVAIFAGLLVIVAAWTVLGGTAKPVASASAHGQNCPTSQPAALAAGETRTVTIKTPKGDIVVQVKADLAPIAAGNFVALASCGFYDGVVFHRTASLSDGTPFVIQGGDPQGTGGGGPGYTIEDEPVTASYVRGTVAMARETAPHSQGSQFFIVLSDAAGDVLKSYNTYAIFGTVTSGMDVADAIYAASNGVELPDNPIAMTSVTVSNP